MKSPKCKHKSMNTSPIPKVRPRVMEKQLLLRPPLPPLPPKKGSSLPQRLPLIPLLQVQIRLPLRLFTTQLLMLKLEQKLSRWELT